MNYFAKLTREAEERILREQGLSEEEIRVLLNADDTKLHQRMAKEEAR